MTLYLTRTITGKSKREMTRTSVLIFFRKNSPGIAGYFPCSPCKSAGQIARSFLQHGLQRAIPRCCEGVAVVLSTGDPACFQV